MKKIGLVGGISWASTVDYYRYINEETNKQLGDLNFAECIIYSINFQHFRQCNAAHDWNSTYALLLEASLALKKAGADLLILGANTAHIVAERIAKATGLPFIDIRDATADAIKREKIRRVGLLGTVFTMELDFYKNNLQQHDIECITPASAAEREYIEETLLYELGKGIINASTKEKYLQIANGLIERGAEGIVLGCTEIPLLLSPTDFTIPVFNTTQIHAAAAVQFALTS